MANWWDKYSEPATKPAAGGWWAKYEAEPSFDDVQAGVATDAPSFGNVQSAAQSTAPGSGPLLDPAQSERPGFLTALGRALQFQTSSSLGMQALDRLTGGAGTDLATLGTGGAVTGTGRAIEGVERLANEPVREAGEVGGLLANIGRAMGVAGPAGAMALHGATRGEAPLNDAPAYQPSALSAGLKAVGEDMSGAVTPAMKQAMRDTQMDGDVLSPSTWTLGRNPSARGLLGHVAKTGGEMSPIVGTAFVNPALAVGAAAGQSASGAYEENADYFLKLPPAELAQVPLFRELVERGVAPDRARAMVADEAGRASMAPAAVIGAGSGVILSGAATRPLARAMAARFGDKFSTRLLANAVGMPLEGGQEVVESVSGRKGANTATGADRSLTEGTFADFAMGMAATGPAAITHSVGGSIDTERVDGEVRNADQERARRLVDQLDRSAQRVETPESRAVDAGREAAAAIFAEADASVPATPVAAQEAVQAAPAQQPAVVPVEPPAPATPRPEAPVLARNDARLAQLESIPEQTLFEREEMELLRNAVDRSRAESDPRQPGVGDAENARAARIADMAATFYKTMPQEIGWSEIGGRVIREAERADGQKSEVVGRTSWVGKEGPNGESNFWRMRPDASLKEKEAHEAFAKAARGERLRPIEQRFIDYARKTADGYAADQMEASELYENQDEADRRAALDYLRDSDGMDVAVEDAAEALTLIELANRAADAGIDPEAYLAEDDAFYAARLWRAIKESGYGAVDPAEASNPARRDQGQEGRSPAAPEGSAEEVTSPPRFSRRDDGIVVEELDDAEAERVIADMQRRQRASLDERADPLVEGFKELAKSPDTFRNQLLPGRTMSELAPQAGITYTGRGEDNGTPVHTFRVDQGEAGPAVAKVYDDGKDVWIDVSDLTAGGGAGERVYNAAFSYARNNGRNFTEDPAGLSDSAMYRRPVQQTAAMLKAGTAENIEPGDFLATRRPGGPQTRPIKAPANREFDATLRENLLTTYNNAVLAVPEISNVRFDAARGQFVDDRTGSVVDDAGFDRLASHRRADPVREAMVRVGDRDGGEGLAPAPVGRNSLKVAALAQSLLRASPSQRPALLDGLRRIASGSLGDSGLSRILPSKNEAPADAGVSVSEPRVAKEAAEKKVASFWGRGAVSRLKSRGRVEFVTKAEVIERGLGGLKSEDDVRGVDGFYDPETSKAYVIADSGASDADLPGVLSHEIMHANGEQFLGSDGFTKLKNAFARLRNREKEIQAAYARVPNDTRAEHVDEEALSYLAQEAPKHRFSERLVDETKLFLNRMGIPLDWLNANAAAVRKIAALNLRDAGKRDVATFNRDGVKFGRAIGDDQPRNDQTDTPAFRNWFGDSKVVDAAGKPLVVYHGSPDARFMDADATFMSVRDRYGAKQGVGAFWFARDRSTAVSYADDRRAFYYQNAKPDVIPAYLSLRNPLVVDGGGKEWREAQAIGKTTDVIKKAQAEGHDGVIIRNVRDNYNNGPRTRPTDTYVVFDSRQIKSAIGNSGAFDPANPDIRFSRDTKRSAVADGVFRDTRGNDPAKRIEGATTVATPPSPEGPRLPKFNSLSEFWVNNIGKPLYDAINGSVGALMRKMQLAENLPPEARKAWREYRQRIGEAQKTVREIGGAARDLTPDEREMVSDFIEREMKAGVTPPEKVERMGTIMSSIMRKQSDELVRLGMLSEEARDRWDGRYLPRFYAKHLATSPFSKELRRVFLQGIKGSHLKGRGMFETVDAAEVERYKELGWEVRGGDPAKGGKVTMWKDFTPAQRQRMGEVRDAMFRFARGYTETQMDIARGNLFDQIAKTIARTDDNAGTFVQVPDTKIPGAGVRKFGNLSGMYVPREVLSQLKATVSPDSALMKAYLKGLSLWKEGKALALDTPIPTPSGWTTMGGIKEGDTLFDENGERCEVSFVTPVQHDRVCYRVEFSDGTSIVADAEHLWLTKCRGKTGVRTTENILATLKERTRGDNNHSILVAGELRTEDANLPIHPYVLGAWLGDGFSRDARICAGAHDAAETMGHVMDCGTAVSSIRSDKRTGVISFRIAIEGAVRRAGGMSPTLRSLNLMGNKHVPPIYLRASERQRRDLLCGMMDTDGHVTEAGKCEYATTSDAIKDGIVELLRSLGYKPVARRYDAKINQRKVSDYWKIKFHAYADKPVFRLARKAARLKPRPSTPQRSSTRQIVGVVPVASVPVRCIQVTSKSKLYLAGEGMVPTHNTTLNPVTHVNNVVSNVVMADLAGINLLDPRSFKLYAETFRDYAREGTAFKEAQAAGLFGNEWFGNEVAQWVPVPAEVRSAQTDAGIAAAFANKGLSIAQAGREAMGRAYQAEDQFFKLLLFKQARAKGLDPSDAVEWAERFVFDYSKAPAGVRMASRTLFPFANYTSKAIPALTFAATHYPWRIAKWVGLLSAVSTYGLSQIHGDDDEAKEAEGRLMPEYMKGGSSFFGVPKAIRLPYNTDEGDAMYVDISRFLPLGDLFDANNQMGGVPLPAPLTPNNPVITTAIAMLANKDSFTGKDLVSESDTGSEAAWKRTAWLWKQMAPNNPVVPGTHNFNRLAEAAAAASGTELGPYTGLDYNGNTISPARAVAQSFGVKLRPVDFERERGFQRSALDAELRELKSKRTKLNRNQSIASSVRDRELESIEAKIEEVMRRIDELESLPTP